MITITDLKRKQYKIKLSELMFIDFSNETTSNNIVLVGIKDKETLCFTDSKEEESEYCKLISSNEFKKIKEYLKNNKDYYKGELYYYTLKNFDFIYEINGIQHIDGSDIGDYDISFDSILNINVSFELEVAMQDSYNGNFVGYFKRKKDFNFKNERIYYKKYSVGRCLDFLSIELFK
jgi:hypothetical protein